MIKASHIVKIAKQNLEKLKKLLELWRVHDLTITEAVGLYLINFSVFDWQKEKLETFPDILDSYEGILMDIPLIVEE